MRYLPVVFGVLSLSAAAQLPPPADLFEEPARWKEIEVKFPAYPRPENLIPFEAGTATPNRFFVDPESIVVGADGVVRYTLVIRTPGGAVNTSFEGIRCATRERKLYAFGRRDGTWMEARNPSWQYIEYQERNRHHGVLYADFFCPNRSIIGNAKQAVDALRLEAGRLSGF